MMMIEAWKSPGPADNAGIQMGNLRPVRVITDPLLRDVERKRVSTLEESSIISERLLK